MSTRRKHNKKRKNKKSKMYRKKNKTYKKNSAWVTAVGTANEVYEKTGSFEKAREKLRNQSIINARRLFSSVNEIL